MVPGGYVWWYLDALSDDGRHAITLIAFIGSVFSPYYAWARRRGNADPSQHCALNVALYGAPRKWAMTERSARSLARDPASLRIGPSALAWDGEALTVQIDEVTAPLPSRIQGHVRLVPRVRTGRPFSLDEAGRHRWWPISPSARVEVALERPALRWKGEGYLDSNHGDLPLEDGFRHWHWSRARLEDGATAVLYDVARRGGDPLSLALRFGSQGQVDRLPGLPEARLPYTGWRVARATRSDDGSARAAQTLEDTPFYARSLVSAKLLGQRVTAVHESLSLERFAQSWVRVLLPFRMPRRR